MQEYLLNTLLTCVKADDFIAYVNDDHTNPYIMIRVRKGDSVPGYLVINTKAPVVEEVIIGTFKDAVVLLSAMVHNHNKPESARVSELENS